MAKPQTAPKHRTAKGARRIQDLTATAADLFLERGFESVAVDDLIARVGGSRRNVYSHFGGKEGLFIEVVTHLCDEIAKPLERLGISEDDPRQALSSFGRRVLGVVLQPRTLALHRLMVAEGRRFPELAQAAMGAGHRKGADILAAWIEAHQGDGRQHHFTNQVSARALAEQFLSMVVAEAQLRALIGLDPQPLPATEIDRIVDNAVATFLRGAAPAREVSYGE
ncbi:MAG: TetR/AcrR family transcriptional regulator [Porticoccaceae bacterium]